MLQCRNKSAVGGNKVVKKCLTGYNYFWFSKGTLESAIFHFWFSFLSYHLMPREEKHIFWMMRESNPGLLRGKWVSQPQSQGISGIMAWIKCIQALKNPLQYVLLRSVTLSMRFELSTVRDAAYCTATWAKYVCTINRKWLCKKYQCKV